MAQCPLPKSTELTDLLIDCDTHVLTIIQTAANGSESHQSVDLSCILPSDTSLKSIDFNCETGQLIIVQETDGFCAGGNCEETFIVDLSCILDNAMPSCDNLTTLPSAPEEYDVVVCTPEGPYKMPPGELFPSFDCSKLPSVCCPPPPGLGVLACNDGELVVTPVIGLISCEDIPSVFPPPDDIEVIVCGGGSLIKIPPNTLLKCEDLPFVSPPPDDVTIIACGGEGGLIKIPPSQIINCADIPVMIPTPLPSYYLMCSEGGMIKIPFDPDKDWSIDINEGEGIDIDVSKNGSHTSYTISSDLCEYEDKTPQDIDDSTSIYFPICIDGGNGKIPLEDMEDMFGGYMIDGHGTALSGDGKPDTPHKVDIALCELTLQDYLPAATIAVCNGAASDRMPAIKAGSNVIIDPDGTLNVNFPPAGARMGSILLARENIGGSGIRYSNPVSFSTGSYNDPYGFIQITGDSLTFPVAGLVIVADQAGTESVDSGFWMENRILVTYPGGPTDGNKYPNSEWISDAAPANIHSATNSILVPAGATLKLGGWSSSAVSMSLGEATVTFIEGA